MFIFSRRWLQSCIDDLVDVLEKDSLRKLIARLNRMGDGRLPAMWELVFLKGLSHAGKLRHEVALPNGRFPDFEWTLSSEGDDFIVWGDITTVSDAGLNERNPVQFLSEEITRLARKYRLNPAHFRYDVRGKRVGEYRKSSMQLFLPKRAILRELIKEHLEPFFRQLSQTPLLSANYSHMSDVAEFSVTYDQTQRYSGGGHLSFDVAVSLTNNPIFRALKAKTAQLSGAPKEAMRLIILCDADCSTMSRQHTSSTAYAADAITSEFLRQSKSVDMVLLATVQSVSRGFLVPQELVLKFQPVILDPKSRPSRITQERIESLLVALNRAVSIFPKPILEPINSVRRCCESGYGYGKQGAYHMGQNRIRISSRALLQLLAGDISQEKFFEDHGWKNGENERWHINQFRQALSRGRMFKAAKIETTDEVDDDWIEFEFSDPDPAISPFRVKDTTHPKKRS